jgi:hypothetical protein
MERVSNVSECREAEEEPEAAPEVHA